MELEQTNNEHTTNEPTPFTEISFLENLFYLGYVESKPIQLYKDDKAELIVVYRTLTPTELRDIVEHMNKYESTMGKVITERIETLARAIVTLNHMPLILSAKERQDIHTKTGKDPSPLEMARIIMEDKIRSIMMIDLLYDGYLKFADDVSAKFSNAKKNLSDTIPSSQT